MRSVRWWPPLLAIGISLSGSAFVGAEIRQPVDFYVMQALHDQNVSDSVLTSPKLRGLHVRDQWKLVEQAPNLMDFAWIDSQIVRAKSFDKQVTLGIYTGNNSPAWLNVPLVDGVPIPWDPVVASAHNELVAELGARYAQEPTVVAVHISSPATDASLEMHFPNGLTNLPDYSDVAVIDVWKSAIDAYAAAFPDTALVLNVGMVPDMDGGVTFPVIEYARQTLGARGNFIHNSLKASTNPEAMHHQTLVNLAATGARIGFEMVSPSTDADRFGGPFSDALVLGEQAGASWYQIYQADVPSIPDQSTLAGDYNLNGVVDAADYTLWRDRLGQTFTLSNENPAAMTPGLVDTEDYAFWKSHFGTTAGIGSRASVNTSVPEPTTLVMLVVATVGIVLRLCNSHSKYRKPDRA